MLRGYRPHPAETVGRGGGAKSVEATDRVQGSCVLYLLRVSELFLPHILDDAQAPAAREHTYSAYTTLILDYFTGCVDRPMGCFTREARPIALEYEYTECAD
jgi:hypothetical protein